VSDNNNVITTTAQFKKFDDFFYVEYPSEKEGKVGDGEDVTALDCDHLLQDKTAVWSSFTFSGVCFF